MSGRLLAATAALLVIRWLVPAEAAETGEQLWIVVGWCILAGAWLWFSPAPRRSWSWMDACVGLLILGHELGGAKVFLTNGQLRSAANLMCEWWGLLCAWLVLREVVLQPDWQAALQRALLAAAVTAALLGIYQHYRELPESTREVMPLIDAFRAGDNSASMALSKLGVPTSEPSLTLYEKRLRDSREPFGFFALANTLGGLLAASMVWGLASLLPPFQRGTQGGRAIVDTPSKIPPLTPPWQGGRRGGQRWMIVVLVVLAWCLALTKSRTAWVGVACGMACLAWPFLRSNGRNSDGSQPPARPIGKWIAACALMVVLVGATMWSLLQTGGLDAQVLLESAKSLSYRGQYWMGTSRLIAESPLFGTGLGQFREHYLRVKLPAASEEIADPHNLVLDAWVNGGLCGLAGLVGLVAVFVRASLARSNGRGAGDGTSNGSATIFVVIGGITAFAVAFVAGLYLYGVWDDRLLVLGVAWCVMFGLLPPRFAGTTGANAALVTLGIHLLGAGGLGMPGVMQMAFVWLAAAAGSGVPVVEASPFKSRVAAVILMLSGVLIAQSVWRPVIAAQVGIEAGDAAFRRADLQSAFIAFHRASADDRWSPTAPARLAEWEFQRFHRLDPSDRQATSADSEPFRNALTYLEEARHRDPNSVIWIRRQAELWTAMHERTQDRAHAARAFDLFQEATRQYPTNAELLVQLSDAAAAAGDTVSSTDAAGRAIEQDDLNRRLGHVERILPGPIRLRLEHRATKRNDPSAHSELGR